MQVAFVHLTKNWSQFENADPDAYYVIQNRGADVLVALEANDTPEITAKDGVLVKPYQSILYKKGEQNLYLRAFELSCSINISTTTRS